MREIGDKEVAERKNAELINTEESLKHRLKSEQKPFLPLNKTGASAVLFLLNNLFFNYNKQNTKINS